MVLQRRITAPSTWCIPETGKRKLMGTERGDSGILGQGTSVAARV